MPARAAEGAIAQARSASSPSWAGLPQRRDHPKTRRLSVDSPSRFGYASGTRLWKGNSGLIYDASAFEDVDGLHVLILYGRYFEPSTRLFARVLTRGQEHYAETHPEDPKKPVGLTFSVGCP